MKKSNLIGIIVIDTKAIDEVLSQVSFGQIVWYEVRKHKFMLAVLYGILITSMYIMNGLPIAIHNVFGR